MLTVNEQKAVEASKGKQVKMGSNAEFGQVLTKCAAYVGATKVPESPTVLIIRETVVEQFPWITFMDMERCCIMNAAHQLIAHSEKDAKAENQPVDHINIFGDLTNANVCAMITRYYLFRNNARAKAARIENELRPQLTAGPTPIVTDDQWMEMHRIDIQRYKDGAAYWSCIAGRMMQWLRETRRITKETFTDMEWKAMKLKARDYLLDKQRMALHKYETIDDYQKKIIDAAIQVHLQTVIYEAFIKKQLAL